MLSLPPTVRYFLCAEPVDMRRSFDGLALLVREILREDPMSGHLFIFRNGYGDRVKILMWDRDGFAIWYKRLEKGVFEIPGGEGRREVSFSDLWLWLERIDASSVKRKKRFVATLMHN